MDVLVDIYTNHITAYTTKEIELGKPKPKEEGNTKESKNLSIYYDLFDSGNQKGSKNVRETNEDNNFMVNRSIA